MDGYHTPPLANDPLIDLMARGSPAVAKENVGQSDLHISEAYS